MKRNFFRLPVLLLLMVSCGGGTHAVFPDPVQLTTEKSNFDSVYLKYPYRVRIVDSLMYVTDLHGDYFCHEFDYPTLQYRKSFARRGKAPGEFLNVANIAVGNDRLLLLDIFARKIYQWKDGQIRLHATLPHETGLFLDFTLYTDSVCILPDVTGINRLCFVNTGGKIIRTIGSIPNSQPVNAHKVALAKAWRSFIHYNPNNHIVALATQLGEVLEVYNLQSGQTYVTVGTDGEPKCVFQETNAQPNGVFGYGDVYVGNRHIYAIYWGHKVEDMKRGMITEEGGRLFRIFDLNGNPLRQYVLDCNITGFCIDEDTQTVVATDPNNEQIVTFSF